MTPNDIARKIARQRGVFGTPGDYTVRGNARITITPAGKRSRTAAANKLRRYAQ